MNRIQEVDNYITGLEDWRGERIAHFRELLHAVSPDLIEEWKWSVPVFKGKKPVMALSAFKEHIKLNFFQGAFLKDSHKLFNNGLESKSQRSIDLKESETIDEAALEALIKAAIELDNQA